MQSKLNNEAIYNLSVSKLLKFLNLPKEITLAQR